MELGGGRGGEAAGGGGGSNLRGGRGGGGFGAGVSSGTGLGGTKLGGQSLLGRPFAFNSNNSSRKSSTSNSFSNDSSNIFSNSSMSSSNSNNNGNVNGNNSINSQKLLAGVSQPTPCTPIASTFSSLLLQQQHQQGGIGGIGQSPNASSVGDTSSTGGEYSFNNNSMVDGNVNSNHNSNYNDGGSYSVGNCNSNSNSSSNIGSFNPGYHYNSIFQSSQSHSLYSSGMRSSSNSSSLHMNNNYNNNSNNFNSDNDERFSLLPPIAADTYPPSTLSSSTSSTIVSSSSSSFLSSSSSSVSLPPSCSRRVPKAEISRKPYNERRDKIMKESLDKLKKDRRKYMNQLRNMRTGHAEPQAGNNGSCGGCGNFDVSFGEMGASARLASSILRSVVREFDTEGSYLFRDDESTGGLDEEEDEFYNSKDYQDLQIKLSLEIEKELKYTDEGDYFDEEEGSFEAQRFRELLEIESFAQSSESCSVLDNPNYLICPFCRLSSMDFDDGSPIMMCSSCLVELNYSAWGSVENLSNSLGDVFDSHHRYCSSTSIGSSDAASESIGKYGGGGSCLESSMHLSDASHQLKPSSTLDRIQIFCQNEGRDLYAMCQFCGFSGKVST